MDENIFSARIKDIAERSQKNDKPEFLGFLSEGESARAKAELSGIGAKVSFFGGYDSALRTYLCVSPKWCENISFPIVAITATYRNQDKLSHRDFLGALMSLGITREKIGDILTEDGRAVFFAEKTVSEFILSQLTKVGRVGVSLSEKVNYPLPEIGKKQEFTATVSSCRLDCVVSALIGASRNKSTEIINNSLVSVNSFLAVKPTAKINSSDRISIRGKGRFDIVSLSDLSKKGRIILRYEKYI
ncbi:MAG: YlmH/Sll1252 family protein [Clostridia bacterium]|nr:YlmH/Sll1252 family protein [Clostridia bacterium]